MSAVIVEAVRSPLGRGRMAKGERPGGSLSELHPVDLLAQVLRGLVDRSGIDPDLVEDVIIGCVSQAAEQAFTPGRLAWLGAGLPDCVPGVTIDRRCGSGQQAIEFGAHGIIAGAYGAVVAGGVESMSRVPMGSARLDADVFGAGVAERYAPGLIGQGVAAELVAARYGISREEMDEYAARSHARAAAAAAVMAREIVPVTAPGADGEARAVASDETIRPGTTVEALAALRPSFTDAAALGRHPEITWSVTAGNSSQITDGAAALLLMSEELAGRLGLRPRARIVATAVCGSDPVMMLTGPIPATEKVLARAKLSLEDIDHVEVNEAFASVPLAWQRHFGFDGDRLNPSGGAIALGHPLGASGARLTTTMLGALEASGGRYGLQTMCENGGMANALIIERL
ncbi:acetyl-CoA C-acetyltransferase/acetyl-CoA acyltransferase [Actinocorallia herbida]|uniref:Acetyl-CoA C-acetyltransferase/acetyl-CoA acyltransferase n=1 Tax=Actinocorallia herbida TaxID=58109 RepID=A0A3N1D392_9ACTN|nr:thiolase family protein [Actinocorallia herbida]ROO87992.1 acetyl-CoA C-acetyltransferase/acetyl-CoA acyltransferase [Actinocorallia herbida]